MRNILKMLRPLFIITIILENLLLFAEVPRRPFLFKDARGELAQARARGEKDVLLVIASMRGKNTNVIKFDKTEFNLSKYGTKSTIFPKIQETSSIKLVNCLSNFIKTKISYELLTDGIVNIIIYDLTGRKIKTLISDFQTAGIKNVNWNATNNNGELVPAGMYFYVIQAGAFKSRKKMVLL